MNKKHLTIIKRNQDKFPHRYLVCDPASGNVLFSAKTSAEVHAASLVFAALYYSAAYHLQPMVLIDTRTNEELEFDPPADAANAVSDMIEDIIWWWSDYDKYELYINMLIALQVVGSHHNGELRHDWETPITPEAEEVFKMTH